ncbi:cilia- and flagella-associated protein 206 isoform X1 [Parasteatoda tepidariorum]|uniref:cilia- and flagella-associated protein 206 isoform X1 n=1 Tax=Parasteatoda tepidariorum TaxID=114398 RepID=UPI0039BC8F6D
MWSETLSLFKDSKIISIIQKLSLLFIQLCQAQNKQLLQTLAQLAIKINLIDSKNRYVINDDVTAEQEQEFLKMCYDNLFDLKNISSLTLRMQCLFHGRFVRRDVFRNHQKHNVMKKCSHLIQKLSNPSEDLKDFQKDLIKLILIKEGMADQNDTLAFHEMKTAVNSIFPSSAISTFVSSNQRTKIAFINEISSIAAGIRLHNWYGQKAGKFMLDVGKVMREILPQMNEDLFEDLTNTNSEIERLEEILLDDGERREYEKRCLIFLRNYYKYIKMIKESVQEVAVHTYKLDYAFSVQLKELEVALKTGPFTKADKVYPSYKDISKTWQNIQMEGRILSFYSTLYEELKTFALKFYDLELRTTPELSQSSVELNYKNGCEIETQRLMPNDVKNFYKITLEFQDFCAYYCSMGILVPCKRELGIIRHGNACYGFSTMDAFEFFEKKPLDCLNAIKQHVLSMPELILTIGMEKIFNLSITNVFSSRHIRPISISDSSAQTMLHPLEEKIVHSYHWNQWKLRKKALQAVDLMDKKTHSTQTDTSHFRRENHSQVYLPKDQSTQTKKDSATNVSGAQILGRL